MPEARETDAFEVAYTAGVVEPEQAPAAPRNGRGSLVRAAPSEAFALKGCVLTPERAIENGYVVVGDGNTIKAWRKQARRRSGPRRPRA